MSGGGAVYWRIKQLEESTKKNLVDTEKAIERLEAKVDRLTMSLIGFALTVAGSSALVVFFTQQP